MTVLHNEAVCELTLSRNIYLAATVAKFIGAMCTHVFSNPPLASRTVVAALELLENAIRYSVDGQSSIHVGFSRIGDGGRVVLLTKNRADGDRKVELTQFFDEMSMSTSRDAFYQTLLHRTMKRTEGSGLGLGRIHAEAEMDLSYQFEGDYVYLRAEANIPTLGGRL